MREGIYFNLPDCDYHAVPGLSNSGMKDLLISPLQYWEKHINPNREIDDSSTDAKDYGRACHRYLLEKDTFFNHYVFVPDDAPRKPTSRQRDAKKPSPETVEAIQWWDVFNAEHEGKIVAKTDWLKDFEAAYKMLQCYPDLKDVFTGGYPEVSIFLKDQDILYKCRIDYLKPTEIIDLKTFSNSRRHPVDRAILDSIVYEKYNLQYFVYTQLCNEARKRLRSRKLEVFGDVSEEFLKAFLMAPSTGFSFVFQESSAPHEARRIGMEKELAEGATTNVYYDEAKRMYEKALSRYKANLKRFGTNPWLGDITSYVLSDEEIPNILYQSY